MRIKVEFDPALEIDEVVIKCHPDNESVKQLVSNLENKLTCYQKDRVYYINLNDIIFFETNHNHIVAHTTMDMYNVKHKLYELEKTLPNDFIRISKSTIANINDIYTINRHLTSASLIEFRKTHKKVYVSRFYYKKLILKLKERN